MLTYNAAKNAGFNACIDKIGRTFFNRHKDNTVFSDGQIDDNVYCYVGVSTEKISTPKHNGVLYLDSATPFEFRASCTVNMNNGNINFLETVLPSE